MTRGAWKWPEAGWINHDEMLGIPASEVADLQRLPLHPSVSVLIMTRNHADYLNQAVESVLAQRFDEPLEILIGEDHSDDSTLDVALTLQHRHSECIRVIHAGANVGIRSNFLRLVVRARAPLLALLEGDDYWSDSQKLALQCDLMRGHPEQVASAAATGNRQQWLPDRASYGLRDLLRRYAVHTSTLLLRAEHLHSYPRFPDNVCWETMLLGYLMARGNCGYLSRQMSFYRRHHGGLWHNADRRRRLQMSWECIDALDSYFFGRFRRELIDRELWIYRMDMALPAHNVWLHWWQTCQLMPVLSQRLFSRSPVSCLLLQVHCALQPLNILFARLRRRLRIGSRLSHLVGRPRKRLLPKSEFH